MVRKAVTQHGDDEDDEAERRRKRGETESQFGSLRRWFAKPYWVQPVRLISAASRINTGWNKAGKITRATATRAEPIEIALDSMNPYCEPDACVIDLDGVDADNAASQDYYPLQL